MLKNLPPPLFLPISLCNREFTITTSGLRFACINLLVILLLSLLLRPGKGYIQTDHFLKWRDG